MKKKYYLLLTAFLFSLVAVAQEEEVTTDPGPFKSFTENTTPFANGKSYYCYSCRKRHSGSCTPSTPTPVPIDGGLGVLMAMGVAYGFKRFRKEQAQ